MFQDKIILITGGTGSFGKQFVHTILKRYRPRKIIIYSRDELKQFEMKQQFPQECLRFFIGDVRDEHRLETAMYQADYVVHAAALKQVPAAEYNPMECIKTNVLGAQNVIDAAMTCGVKKVVALSTDKAANPINLYGASKLCADKLFMAADSIAGARGVRFAVVRYGNVVGSRGSVVPFFRHLIDEGVETLPITDQRMTRFWLQLQDAVDFVLLSFMRMQRGEMFVPKIPSIRITDLAKAMAPELQTHVIGIRPGEKLHEIMCPVDTASNTIEYETHYVIVPSMYDKEAYLINSLNERGKYVSDDFEYNSKNNPDFLSVEEIRKKLP